MITPLMVYVYCPSYPNMDAFCSRFVNTYKKFPPEYTHRLCIVVNGSPVTDHIKSRFDGIKCEYALHNNVGWDIGAYIKISEDPAWLADAIFCCGSTTHFKKAGWLNRICSVWNDLGPNLYGSHGSHEIRPHIRTAAGFLVPPFFLASYPNKPTQDTVNKHERYNFEHGECSLTWYASVLKHKSLVVTWDGVYEMPDWPAIYNGYRHGDQSNCLCYDRMLDAFCP